MLHNISSTQVFLDLARRPKFLQRVKLEIRKYSRAWLDHGPKTRNTHGLWRLKPVLEHLESRHIFAFCKGAARRSALRSRRYDTKYNESKPPSSSQDFKSSNLVT